MALKSHEFVIMSGFARWYIKRSQKAIRLKKGQAIAVVIVAIYFFKSLYKDFFHVGISRDVLVGGNYCYGSLTLLRRSKSKLIFEENKRYSKYKGTKCLYFLPLFNCLLTQISNQQITRQQLNVFRNADMAQTFS